MKIQDGNLIRESRRVLDDSLSTGVNTADIIAGTIDLLEGRLQDIASKHILLYLDTYGVDGLQSLNEIDDKYVNKLLLCNNIVIVEKMLDLIALQPKRGYIDSLRRLKDRWIFVGAWQVVKKRAAGILDDICSPTFR